MRDLPESDEEDEGDETDGTQALSASSERKVSFSEAAGTDSQKAQATRKGKAEKKSGFMQFDFRSQAHRSKLRAAD
eukprot:symbB.v1.2.034548.t1/scaffold4468.1/size39341/2